MVAMKRNSVKINFGSRDTVDLVLFDTMRSLAQENGCGNASALKRMATLGAFLLNGYDARAITDRLPKQKILWVEAIWPLLRRYSTGTAQELSSESDLDAADPSLSRIGQTLVDITLPTVRSQSPRSLTIVESPRVTGDNHENDNTTRQTDADSPPLSPRLNAGKLKFSVEPNSDHS